MMAGHSTWRKGKFTNFITQMFVQKSQHIIFFSLLTTTYFFFFSFIHNNWSNRCRFLGLCQNCIHYLNILNHHFTNSINLFTLNSINFSALLQITFGLNTYKKIPFIQPSRQPSPIFQLQLLIHNFSLASCIHFRYVNELQHKKYHQKTNVGIEFNKKILEIYCSNFSLM